MLVGDLCHHSHHSWPATVSCPSLQWEDINPAHPAWPQSRGWRAGAVLGQSSGAVGPCLGSPVHHADSGLGWFVSCS